MTKRNYSIYQRPPHGNNQILANLGYHLESWHQGKSAIVELETIRGMKSSHLPGLLVQSRDEMANN